jgi:hypothetical protein
MDFIRHEDGQIWVCSVINGGHEKAEKLELQVPQAIQSLLIHSDDSRDVIAGGIIKIPELRPDEQIRIVSWVTRATAGEPKVLQAKGKVIIRRQELVPSPLAQFYKIWLQQPGFLIIFLVSLALVFLSILNAVLLTKKLWG